MADLKVLRIAGMLNEAIQVLINPQYILCHHMKDDPVKPMFNTE